MRPSRFLDPVVLALGLLLAAVPAVPAVAGGAAGAAGVAEADDDLPPVAEGAVEKMVPMRDGVRLATNVFLPEGTGPWPVILTRTPYGKDGGVFPRMASRYAGASYAYVVQDVRGKFRSEGEYRPFERAMEDGYDTVVWITQQEFSNGKVGMSGASAMGITANMAAAANPPGLEAAFVVVAPHSMFAESTFIGGVFKEADVGNWMRRQGAGDQVAATKARVLMSDYWRNRDLSFHIDTIDIPIYNVGGWYDIFSQGNVSNFVYLQTQGHEGARGNQKLLMGPFGHGELQGDLEYADASGGLMMAFGDELRWFDYWLKGEDNGIMDEPPVKYYMMASARKGAASPKNGWRTADGWPLATEELRLYLTPESGLTRDCPCPKNELLMRYDFDPEDPVPTVGGANLTLPLGPMDQRTIGERRDYLRFETAPLEEDLAIAGRVRLELWAETDAPDTDFMVKLVDVYPDGYEALLLDAPMRARYRSGREPEHVEPMTPEEPQLIVVDLWSTANTFEKGHRLAVHITSSNYPRFEVNPNTFDPSGEEAEEARVAKNSIHLDAEHPTALVLPVLGR